MWAGILTWWRWNSPASSAATTRPSTPSSRKWWSTRAHPTSASRILTKTSPAARLRSALRPSATFSSATEDMVRERQKRLAIDEQLKKFEEQLRQEMAIAEKYKNVERPQAPADALIQIGNAPLGEPAQSNELVEMSGD